MSEAVAAPAPRSGSKMFMVILVAVLAAGAAGTGVYFMTGKKGDEATADAEHKQAKAKLPPTYVKLDPPFVSNFESRGAMRFLQVSVEVMTRDVVVADLVKQHDPMVRNDLLMLFGTQTYDTISTAEGKEQLRTKALEAVRNVITTQGGDGAKVEQLYFTSFVMQ
ncbi:MAG TPA: flagellar basal body-associated FliL family protein [Povalibacter sp.]|uniref:flagellar basal body-associated FliL family protein n=1 Tax=Povalibacter sp. TaxID=1962978 RepID=UPI002C31AEF8|nr:flagellar basal body-associated FliL family protein [Povalibacter sp.]HMN44425.1 flagellar basal body-associated FliL family protein [Povalibacter sp.]